MIYDFFQAPLYEHGDESKILTTRKLVLMFWKLCDGKHLVISSKEVFDTVEVLLKPHQRFTSQVYAEAGFRNILLNYLDPDNGLPLLFDRHIGLPEMYAFKRIGFYENRPLSNPLDVEGDLLLMNMGKRTDILKCVCIVKDLVIEGL